MTNDEAIKELKDASDSEVRYGDTKNHYDEVMRRVEAFDMAIKALEAQPCEDAISREAVDKYIIKLMSGYLYEEERERLEEFSAYIWELPSVTPTRPKGRWLEQQDIHKHHYGWFFCSECGAFLMSLDGANYCSCCGAKMEVDE
jgi:hypothetical protein